MADMTLEQVANELRITARHGASLAPQTCHYLADAIDAAIKQREQDKKNVARYRWLRDNPEHPSVPYFGDGRWYIAYEVSNAGGFGGGVGAMPFDTLDAAIDVAMKEGATRAC